jgi:FkbM family methyltransferase
MFILIKKKIMSFFFVIYKFVKKKIQYFEHQLNNNKKLKGDFAFLTVHHSRFFLDIKDNLQKNFYINKKFELHLQEIFIACILPEHDVYDVGAHAGLLTVKFANILKRKEKSFAHFNLENKGRVFAFEPTESSFKNLGINTLLNSNNDHSEMIIYNLAISDTNSFKEMYLSKPNKYLSKSNTLETNKIVIENLDSFLKKKVQCKTLDNIYEQNQLKKVSLIKIDVGGHEFNVLEGSKAILNNSKPSIVFEFSKHNLEIQKFNIKKFNFLYEFSYKTYVVYRECGSFSEFSDFKKLETINSNLFKEIFCISKESFL